LPYFFQHHHLKSTNAGELTEANATGVGPWADFFACTCITPFCARNAAAHHAQLRQPIHHAGKPQPNMTQNPIEYLQMLYYIYFMDFGFCVSG
jgi:hypothetical protein